MGYLYCVRTSKLYRPTTANGFDHPKLKPRRTRTPFKMLRKSNIKTVIENGNTDQTLTPIDLLLSFLKPLSVEWLVQLHADIKSDKTNLQRA